VVPVSGPAAITREGRGMSTLREGQRIRRYSFTPLVKQTPVAITVALAVVLSLTVPRLVVSDVTGLVAALALVVVATVLAAIVTAQPAAPPGLVGLVPAIDFLALGVLRWATGSSASVFTAVLALPVVWVAAQEGRRFAGWAVLGAAVVILTPFLFGPGTATVTAELIRLAVVLVSYATLAVVVNQLSQRYAAQLRLAEDRESLARSEIRRAADVQRSLLPQPAARGRGHAVAGACLPSRSVGGDFFDWYETDDGFAMTLGDVMGKGVGAGLIAAAVRAVVRSARSDPDPAAALRRVSSGLMTGGGDPAATSFTTLFHARFRGSVMRWVDAGHGLTVIARQDGTSERLVSADLPVGLGFDETWTTHETELLPGDLVVSFSDGVLDLFSGELDTLQHVAAIAREDPRPAAVVDTLIAFARTVDHDDDVTVIAFGRDAVGTPPDPAA
jgi:sigma-B regulation protein RsbU (phosphoserine phosphatase)